VSTIIGHQRISQDPAIMGGKPCIAGHRIRVMDIYIWHELQGQSVDEIVTAYAQLSHTDVYSALAYFWEHRGAILEDMEREAELLAQMQVGHSSKLAAKLKAMDAGKVSS